MSRKFLLAFSSHHAETITYYDGSGEKFEDMEPEQYLLLRTIVYLTEKKKLWMLLTNSQGPSATLY